MIDLESGQSKSREQVAMDPLWEEYAGFHVLRHCTYRT